MEVAGYQVCANEACLRLVLDPVAFKTGGICDDCARKGVRERLERVELAVQGGRVSVSTAKKPQTARNRRQHLRRKGDPRVQARKHAAEKAKIAAWKRLAAAAPELYALILADERAQRGLTPITIDAALAGGPGEQAWETLGALEFYRALSSQEYAPDATDHTPPHPHEPSDERARA